MRVRPFNQREIDHGSKSVIQMDGASTRRRPRPASRCPSSGTHAPAAGNTTTIVDPSGVKPTRTFQFDHSYWSFDGCTTDAEGVFRASSPKCGGGAAGGDGGEGADKRRRYTDQATVFEDLGRGMLDNAWDGYNAALFAYGQTGSGKSYSMIGYGPNRGIVPLACHDVFARIAKNRDKSVEYQVTFSMLEIYNERVRDLLAVKDRPGGAKVRQHPDKGFFVHGLTQDAVGSAEEILQRMDAGAFRRTTAATVMNESSSRSHMVITIQLKQVLNAGTPESVTKTSDIHMVDLAGSERAETSGTTADRLQEGSAINQSLSCLGNVISALAEKSQGKPGVRVPYRDSVLTKLLKNALGGNSRTIMISALSPAAINYEETLSTLRYADRAKQIQCKAVVNESATDKLIRELKDENAKLMQMIKSGEVEGLKEVLQANQANMDQMQMSWKERLANSKARGGDAAAAAASHAGDCYFQNINEDPQLSGVILQGIKAGGTLISRQSADKGGKGALPEGIKHQMALGGLSIQAQHAVLERRKDEVVLEPVGNAQVIVNGKRLLQPQRLLHNDRVVLAPNHIYKFVAAPAGRTEGGPAIDFDFVQMEIAAAQGLTGLVGGTSTSLNGKDEQKRVKEDLLALLPMISEANAISEELGKGIVFDLVVRSGAAHNLTDKSKQVMVKVTDRTTLFVWLWSKAKFINRKYLMQELYELWIDGETIETDQHKDPFWDPPEDIFLGSVYLYLQSLSYQIDIEETLAVTNYEGNDEGQLHVALCPCDATGRKLTEDMYVSNPSELLETRMDLLVKIPYARNLKWVQADRTRGVSCRFKFYTDTKMRCTKVINGDDNPNFDYTKQFTIKSVSHNFNNYLEHNALVIEMWGTQGTGTPVPMTHVPSAAGAGAGADDPTASLEKQMDDIVAGEHWKAERATLLRQMADLRAEVDFLKAAKGQLEKEVTRITLDGANTFIAMKDDPSAADGGLTSMVERFLLEDKTLRERLEEAAQQPHRPSKAELKSLKSAVDTFQKTEQEISKALGSVVGAARAVTTSLGKKKAAPS